MRSGYAADYQLLSLKNFRAADPDIVAYRDGKTVEDVFLPGISVFKGFRDNGKQCFPYVRVEGVNPAVQSAFTRHIGNISVFFKEQGGGSEIPAEKPRRCKNDGHHFGIVHFCLKILSDIQGGKQFAAEYIKSCYLKFHNNRLRSGTSSSL
ncbi:MAG: hypothetical protein D3906_15660, partial [Candidatus Electrothrix sp. AUS1_2]|nr:hypothetical protein [Candidatus Electrothrix sp. AUS1_2]